MVERAFTRSGFSGTFRGRLSKKDDGAKFFIELLLRPERIVLDLLPVVGAFSARALARRHDDPLFAVVPLSYW